jgi:aldehyde:ferredoxin oxidoreductase
VLNGYNGVIAHVDLSTAKISYEHIDEETARKYIGGVGLAAKILWDETTSDTKPLSPENPLLFMTGPLTGSTIPKSSRYIIAGISPLTNIWGQSHSGGSWADEIRHAGFDGIVVKGQSSKPVYLWLHNQEVEIRDASHLWGKDTYEVSDLLKRETDRKASPACIGPAGEKLVKFAGVINDGREGRAAARCGLGAVMGSKNLKAIVARGTLPINFYDEEKFKEDAQRILSLFPVKEREEALETDLGVLYDFLRCGRVPVKNWSEGTFDGTYVYIEDLRKAKPLYCKRCPYSCMESYLTTDGERHMVWEAWGPLGTNCLIANPEVLQQAYSICNRYGMDTISIGAVIAFAMECFEKGLITKDDTGGVELTWGNERAMIEMVRKIGEREGFGELLGEGVRIAAERIGGISSEFAMHVKGLEFPAHDPRAAAGLALGYATASIGAAHMETQAIEHLENQFERAQAKTSPELGYPDALNRFETEGKGALVAKTQDLGCLLDSVIICMFLSLSQWVQPSHYVELLNSAIGWDMDINEFMLTGERIFNLKRMFNVRRGISRKDDTLPLRILAHKLVEGGTKGNLPHLGLMLNEYYAVRGWSEEGIPKKERLAKLDLEQCIREATIHK